MREVSDLLGCPFRELRATSVLRGEQPQLEEIGDRKYVSLPQRGISLVMNADEAVITVQLHGEDHEGFSQFNGDLPGGLAFAMSRQAVRSLIGTPSRHGERQVIPVLGVKPAWDSYVIDGCIVHVEYTDDERAVQLVSVIASA